MPTSARNRIDSTKFSLAQLRSEDFSCAKAFDCGKNDLNEFFCEDALFYKEHLFAEIYYLQPYQATEERLIIPVAFVSFSNDHISLTKEERKEDKKGFWKTVQKSVPHKLRGFPAYPAVKICRLGVKKEYQRGHIGTHLINMTKQFFLTHNRTGCRFITVDADNDDATIPFYQKNGFQFLWDGDQREETRIMYFDLKRYTGDGVTLHHQD
jgi:GNAT superfamily N-acetyltransferase